jgi:hypothetical protein
VIEQLGADPVPSGRAAVARGAWTEAFDLLSSADRTQPLALDVLPAFADAAYMTSRPDIAIGIWGRAHAQALKGGDPDGAANAALRLCVLMIDTTKMGPLAAWTRRLDALLVNRPECGLHAGAAIVHSFTDVMTGEIARALEWAEKDVVISERVGDRGQVALALNAKGGPHSRRLNP